MLVLLSGMTHISVNFLFFSSNFQFLAKFTPCKIVLKLWFLFSKLKLKHKQVDEVSYPPNFYCRSQQCIGNCVSCMRLYPQPLIIRLCVIFAKKRC